MRCSMCVRAFAQFCACQRCTRSPVRPPPPPPTDRTVYDTHTPHAHSAAHNGNVFWFNDNESRGRGRPERARAPRSITHTPGYTLACTHASTHAHLHCILVRRVIGVRHSCAHIIRVEFVQRFLGVLGGRTGGLGWRVW